MLVCVTAVGFAAVVAVGAGVTHSSAGAVVAALPAMRVELLLYWLQLWL